MAQAVEGLFRDGDTVTRNVPVLVAGVDTNGAAQTLAIGTDGALSVNTAQTGSATATLANVASDSSQTVVLQAANTSRKGWTVFNDSTSVVYVKFGATASSTSLTVIVPAGGYYELPQPVYTGVIHGRWASTNGNARVTEW